MVFLDNWRIYFPWCIYIILKLLMVANMSFLISKTKLKPPLEKANVYQWGVDIELSEDS